MGDYDGGSGSYGSGEVPSSPGDRDMPQDRADGRVDWIPGRHGDNGAYPVDGTRFDIPPVRLILPRGFIPVERRPSVGMSVPARVPVVTQGDKVAWLTDVDLERLEKRQMRRGLVGGAVTAGAAILNLLALGEALYRQRHGADFSTGEASVRISLSLGCFCIAVSAGVVPWVRAATQADRIRGLRDRLRG